MDAVNLGTELHVVLVKLHANKDGYQFAVNNNVVMPFSLHSQIL